MIIIRNTKELNNRKLLVSLMADVVVGDANVSGWHVEITQGWRTFDPISERNAVVVTLTDIDNERMSISIDRALWQSVLFARLSNAVWGKTGVPAWFLDK